MDELEKDEDSNVKFMGPAKGCFTGCKRSGYDYTSLIYTSNNPVNSRYIESVPSALSCLQICNKVEKCKYIR